MKLIVLDRDGVINVESSDFIKSPDQWKPIKGSLNAIAKLTQVGFHIVVITNQSGIGRDYFSTDTLNQIHLRMIEQVSQHGGKIHSIFFCPHTDNDNCACRKPRDGMYQELAKRLNISLKGIVSVGDSLRDLQAAKTAGATPVLVRTGNGKKTLKQIHHDNQLGLMDTPVFDNLSQASDAVLSNYI